MSAAFADTFYFLALLNPRDRFHARAQEISRRGTSDIVTTRAVLLEVGDAFADVATRSLAAEFLQTLDGDPGVQVLPLAEELYARGLALYRERPDKCWSLTDCVSFVVMQQRGITDALTGDHHFAQAGFVALLTDA